MMRPPLFDRLNRAVRRASARIGGTLAQRATAIVAPIEWAIAAAFRRLVRMIEVLEGVDDRLAGPMRLLLWPVRTLWRLLEWFNLDAPIRGLVWLLQPVWRPVAAVAGFGYAWLTTRPYRRMAWGLPALMLLGPIVIAVAWGGAWGREGVAVQYRTAIQDARDAADYPRLLVLERKLSQLGVDSQRTDFHSALALEEQGRLDEAFERMQRLAPEASIGYPPAHEWLALKLLGGELNLPQQDRLLLAGAHLDHLEKLGAKGPDMALLRGVWFEQSNRLEEAADVLAPHIGRRQMTALRRMGIDLRLNRLDEARRDARALRLHLQESQAEAKRRGDALDAELYQAWAEAERLLGDRPGMARVARQWLRDDPANSTAQNIVAEVSALEFNEMLASMHPDADALAQRLIEMATVDEEPARLNDLVAAWFRERETTPVIGAMIDKLIAAEEAPLPLVAALGTAAASEGEIAIARQLLGRVVEGDPQHATAWNNLAWALAQEPGSDLPWALEAVNRAIDLSPEVRFRETRGQILVALGRWQEAVDDLEAALHSMPNAAVIHASLAKAYAALGNDDLAEMHRQQVP